MYVGDFPLAERLLPEEELACVDRTLFERQESAARDARTAEDEARRSLAEANAEWHAAHLVLTELHMRAVRGDMPPLNERAAAQEREALARVDVEWREKVLTQTTALRERVEAEFAAARQAALRDALIPWGENQCLVAWAGAVERAQRIERLLEQYRAISLARQTRPAEMAAHPRRQDWPDLDAEAMAVDQELIAVRKELQSYIDGAGREAWEQGFQALHAVGALRPNRPAWPRTIEEARRLDEAEMRRHFDKPRPGESFLAPVYNPLTDAVFMAHLGARNRARRRA
jgi:hypothetical protein